jgi:two-component system alkaline phosphatase synthesis response regulator PhoP
VEATEEPYLNFAYGWPTGNSMATNYKIAIVEDDDLIRHMIQINLEKSGFSAFSFPDGEALLDIIRDRPFDLIILDNLLPRMSGLALIRKLKQYDIHTPVLMLSVRGEVSTKIEALNSGADDYLVKPFNLEELLARANALIRRSHSKRHTPAHQILTINRYKINLSTRECQSNLGNIILSEKEIKLISYLSQHAHEILRRADILEEVWGMDVSPTPRTIDNFILKFRKLFETNPENPRHFLTVRNIGYRFEF